MVTNLTHEDRLQSALKRYEHEIAELKQMKELADFVSNNLLMKNRMTQGNMYVSNYVIQITLNNIDIPTVIEHVCGPIHQRFKVDWKMSVESEWNKSIRLETRIPMDSLGIEGLYLYDSFPIKIFVTEGEMESCSIETVKVRKRTTEEILEAAKFLEWDTKQVINCTGE